VPVDMKWLKRANYRGYKKVFTLAGELDRFVPDHLRSQFEALFNRLSPSFLIANLDAFVQQIEAFSIPILDSLMVDLSREEDRRFEIRKSEVNIDSGFRKLNFRRDHITKIDIRESERELMFLRADIAAISLTLNEVARITGAMKFELLKGLNH
jgi:hypothetical protein